MKAVIHCVRNVSTHKRPLPLFRYHPDPITSASIVPSSNRCLVCGETPGFVYAGPLFCSVDLHESICPWCIHDGAAHNRFEVEFVDRAAVGGYGAWEQVETAIVDEICFRTPAFNGWQQERWYTHCGDAAEFIGIFGWEELRSLGEGAIRCIAEECGYDAPLLDQYLRSLDRDRGPTGYLFRCLKCGKIGGYSDCH
jgi:uncharacterized protein